MKDKVLSPLKCSFDKLEEKTNQQMEERAVEMRQCLLYCSLFSEDQNIYIDQLIDYWIGEGFLDAGCYLNPGATRDKGRVIVRKLTEECFLEGIASYADDHKKVKLHDVVRGMAMWLTDGNSE
ncbi:hypothetical protein Taro_049430 [Colocasia esculenta]|uniref:Disease resistance protein winged helix domain-containing protein n=1 Tax=Colocasia esculenta TaxID=4460 RepID=A0A843XAV3_COLES|nr:hypothetical protein [Colocasia esculenta]